MVERKRKYHTSKKTTTREGKKEYQMLLMRDRRATGCKLCGMKSGHLRSCPFSSENKSSLNLLGKTNKKDRK